MRIPFPNPTQDYKVLCYCITYNQAKFIEDTMNGFVMQQTDFPFVCTIIDDASTDGEQDVIKAYLSSHFDMENAVTHDIETAIITIARSADNPNCTFAVFFLKKNLWKNPEQKEAHIKPWVKRCQYVAFCEGDDYWIDPQKLQTQVNILDSHHEYGLCYTNFNIRIQASDRIINDVLSKNMSGFPSSFSNIDEFILSRGYYCPPSWLMRQSTLKTINRTNVFLDTTFVVFAQFLITSQVYFLNKTTSVYRVLNESASHSSNYEKTYIRGKNLLQSQLWLIDTYNLGDDLKTQCLYHYYGDVNRIREFIFNDKAEDIDKSLEYNPPFKAIDRLYLWAFSHRLTKPLLLYAYKKYRHLEP